MKNYRRSYQQNDITSYRILIEGKIFATNEIDKSKDALTHMLGHKIVAIVLVEVL